MENSKRKKIKREILYRKLKNKEFKKSIADQLGFSKMKIKGVREEIAKKLIGSDFEIDYDRNYHGWKVVTPNHTITNPCNEITLTTTSI